MRSEPILLACAIILAILLRVQSYVQEEYSGKVYLQQQIESLEQKVESEKLQSAKADFAAMELQQQVAQNLPQFFKGKNDYMARNIASVLDEHNESPQALSLRFQRAKRLYSEEKYPDAILILEEMLREKADGVINPEATFLLLECYEKIQQKDKVVEIVEEMLAFYPESPLTGYALLRVAKVYEEDRKYQDAANVYRSIQSGFSFDKRLQQIVFEKLRRISP